MKNRNSSSNLLRIVCVLTLTMLLLLGSLSPASAADMSSTVVAWGDYRWGQTTIPSGLTHIAAIAAAGNHNLALKEDGSLVAWGDSAYGMNDIPSGLTGSVKAIAAGYLHNLVLKNDGTVVAWGTDGYGQTDVPSGLTGVTAIAAGWYYNLALKEDGTVVAWGDNTRGQIDVPPGLSGVKAIAAGAFHSLALKNDGTVVAWGWNSNGQSNIPVGLSGVVALAAGEVHSLALKNDGTVVAWGYNYAGDCEVPSSLTGVKAIAAGSYTSLALKDDGTVVAWGENSYGATTVPSGLKDVIAIAAGAAHNLALVPLVNTAPVANSGGPYLASINTSISFDGSLSYDAEDDVLTYAWDFGDGSTGTGAKPTHSYTAAGVYNVCLTVNDISVNSSPACILAVVYDPSAGFVTGSGSIDSPAGAYTMDPSMSGKATFGFISKYRKGATVPDGTTQFQFQAGSFSFFSSSYDWLVVDKGGTNAQFKSSGAVNGAALDPNGNPYKFMLWAVDGSSTSSPDTFRIRIWSEGTDGSENVVYDNGTNQAINTGNIVVHTGK